MVGARTALCAISSLTVLSMRVRMAKGIPADWDYYTWAEVRSSSVGPAQRVSPDGFPDKYLFS